MVSEEADFETILQIEEQESQRAVPAALEQEAAEFADADAAVDMRTAERFGQLQQSIPALVPNRFWQC